MTQRNLVFIVIGVIAIAGIIIFLLSGGGEPEAPVAKKEMSKDKEMTKKPVTPGRPVKRPDLAAAIPEIIPGTEEAEGVAEVEDEPLPEVTDAGEKNPFAGMLPDEVVRKVANPLRPSVDANRWLAGHNLISKIVSIVSAIAKGEFPHQLLAELSPRKPFAELGFQGEAHLDISIYERYTPMAQFIGSLNTQAVVSAIELLEPILEPAYRDLGQHGSFRRELRKAIKAVLDVQVTQFRTPLKKKTLSYTFADEKLEQSNGLTKLMYRIGPNNSMLIQAKLKEIRKLL